MNSMIKYSDWYGNVDINIDRGWHLERALENNDNCSNLIDGMGNIEDFLLYHYLFARILKRIRFCHYSDVIMGRWRLKSPTSRLLAQPFVQAQIYENIKASYTGLCEGNWAVTGEFPVKRASDAENVSIWWRHYDDVYFMVFAFPTCPEVNMKVGICFSCHERPSDWIIDAHGSACFPIMEVNLRWMVT